MFLILLFILNLCCGQLVLSDNKWINQHYTRSIDLSKGFVKEIDIIDIKNIDNKPQDVYYFTINDGFDSIGSISLFQAILNENSIEVVSEEIESKIYKINLPFPISPNSNVELKFNYIYSNTLTPIPGKISLDDTQQLLFKTNKFPFSPYETNDYSLSFTGMTKGQEMELHLNKTENLPVLEPRVESNTLKYGPAFDLPPFSLQPMGLMYDHNRPLTKANNLYRSIWLPASDINKVSIEEYYELTNQGAQLDKGFSRFDWMKGRYESTRNHWALSHLEIPLLNRNLEEHYFIDKVGMNSNSKFIQNHLLLQPRFPLFGGWNYNFTLGWNEELSKFLHLNEDYILKFPLLNSVRDVVYDNVYLEFYLPESSEFKNFSSPIPYESISVDNELSYLDVSKGHVKVTVHYKNLFDNLHKLDVYLTYKYSKTDFYLKIGKISGFVFIGLISYYLLGLVNLNIN
ncbi:unnamed protein product [Candida verbasci]|uniref:Dolichyl-diphosphooligosaccharide--protein glycosyltransferase subunit 1 n=1 Tax=Candida verbasci TaxID=1227364 RepID=A0A9W4TU83_9ASCO|nr:unnamed protein product [Candida verbasci]